MFIPGGRASASPSRGGAPCGFAQPSAREAKSQEPSSTGPPQRGYQVLVAPAARGEAQFPAILVHVAEGDGKELVHAHRVQALETIR